MRVIGGLGVERDAVLVLGRPGEELGDVEELLVVLRHAEVVAILGLEVGHLGRVLEPVLAIGPAVGVALERDRPVLAAVLRVVLQRRRHERLVDAIVGDELGQVDIVAAFGGRAQPLAVADDHVVGVALGVELGEGLGLEIAPRRRFDGDRDAGLGGVLVDQFLQVVRRIPFGPEDRQFLRNTLPFRGKRHRKPASMPFVSVAHVLPPLVLISRPFQRAAFPTSLRFSVCRGSRRPVLPTGFGADPAICRTCPHAQSGITNPQVPSSAFLRRSQSALLHDLAQKTLHFHLLP